MYYPCSENKGADQLCSYRKADLRLCFSHMQNVRFLKTRLIYSTKKNLSAIQYIEVDKLQIELNKQMFAKLISFLTKYNKV